MRSLVIGYGEVGRALEAVIKDHHETFVRDLNDIPFIDGLEVLHICYPEHAGFVDTTKKYIDFYKPKLTIIHSSVSVGTTEKCDALYSPVRGRHPKLDKDLRIYVKFVFGKEQSKLDTARSYFEKCGITTIVSRDIKGGELVKVLSNVHMGIEIAWRQEVQRMIKLFGIDQGTYEEWERTYNDGYLVSNDFNLIRPLMRPDPIGGHCILPCTEILKAQYPSPLFDFVLQSNEKTKGDK